MVKISVIVPVYNVEKYIIECLSSIVAQSFKDYEVIIVNDGSTDNTQNIIEKYIKGYTNFKLFNQKNQGVVVARNNAIKASSGEYIYPLDGDDLIVPTCLEKLYNAMQNNKGDVIYSQTEFFGDKTGLFENDLPTKLNMAKGNKVVCSALYKKADAIKYGCYDYNMKLGLEDWEFWCNFIYDNKKFHRINETLFYYRQSTESRNSSYNDNIKLELYNYIIKKHNLLYIIILTSLFKFIYFKKITKSNKLQIKICKIPVYSRRIK